MIEPIRSFVLVLFVVLTVCPLQSNAQSTSKIDLKTVNVNELSDEQVLDYIRKAEARGLGQSELELLARQRGMSESEITKLRSRILTLKAAPLAIASSDNQNPSPITDPEANNFSLVLNDDVELLSSEERQIFGMSLFRKRDLSFSPNLSLPTPVDYVLGPGDEIIVDLWGSTQQFLKFPISSEGTIRPSNTGPIFVNGLTIERATTRIIDRLSQVYEGLKPQSDKSPTIFYQVSLGSIRTINIEIIGAVEQSGTYALPSLATVYTALHASGGPSLLGSFRDIRLVRNDKLLSSIDIYSFLTSGIKSGDVRLRNGDVIVVPSYLKRVKIEGEVKVPGFFELKENESFGKMLEYVNGFSDGAYKNGVSVQRNGAKERELLDIEEKDFDTFYPKNGDLIEVGKILSRYANRVVINGAVFRPGEYQLTEGLTLKSLVSKADGLRGDAFMARATVYRIQEDFLQEILPVDLKGIIDGTIEDLALQPEDIVTISSVYDLKEEYYVQISGEVLENGIFPFFKHMTVQDLIVLAGGLKESASSASVEISRRNKNGSINSSAEIISLTIDQNLSLANEDRELVLEPFDQVYIRMKPSYSVQQQVKLEGEIVSPGMYTISRKDERVSDIIKRANGFTAYAYLKGAILIRRTEYGSGSEKELVLESDLENLREKVLSSQSEVKNSRSSELLLRIDKLKSENSQVNGFDVQGSNFKKKLLQGFVRSDSLVGRLDLEGLEPVALDLQKIMETPGSELDFMVRPGDLISIPSRLETVRVAGEVTSPLNVGFNESLSFKEYVNLSGGFLATAKKGGSYVQYPNGERRGVKRFLWFKRFPKIEPGSTIVVSRKPQRNRIDFQTVIASITSLATLALIIDRVRN